MHDDYIVSYSVNFSDNTIVLRTHNEDKEKDEKLEFLEVLTHSFYGALKYNQILAINEYEIDNFIKDNKEILERTKNYCWPVDYQSIDELKAFLSYNGYKYIKVMSSYGMSGWVLAKSFRRVE